MAMIHYRRTLIAASAAFALALCGCLAASAGHDANSGIKADIAAIRQELKNQAGRDVNSGLSSRGIAFIAITGIVVCGACYALNRWDRNRSNRIITEHAVRRVNGGDN